MNAEAGELETADTALVTAGALAAGVAGADKTPSEDK